MFTDHTIKIYAALIFVCTAALGFAAFQLPGLLIGLVAGAVLGLGSLERMRRMTPEGRRRYKRMLRNEGLE